LAVELSFEQELALAAIDEWFASGRREMRVGGLAGTGKTTIIARCLVCWN